MQGSGGSSGHAATGTVEDRSLGHVAFLGLMTGVCECVCVCVRV